MADLPSAANIKELVSLFAPGMILLWARSRVKAGPAPDLQERFIGYAVASTAYFAAISPFFYVDGGLLLPRWLWSVLHYALLPMLLGWLVAFANQKGWEYRLAEWTGLKFAHEVPAAWDYTFSRLSAGAFLLATLKNGQQVAGKWASTSFASSSKDERDLHIAEVWDVGPKGEWKSAEPQRSVLLCGNEIHYIEIFQGVLEWH